MIAMESKRQQQVGNLIKQNLMTPDLYIARIYLSIYNANKTDVLDMIKSNTHAIKKSLVRRIKNKMRSMPVLEFYVDETLDEVFKMDEL